MPTWVQEVITELETSGSNSTVTGTKMVNVFKFFQLKTRGWENLC